MKIRDFLDLNINGFYKWETIANTEEFIRMKGCEQNPYWHAEGDVWEHTKRVCEEAVMIVEYAEVEHMTDDDKEILLVSALFHDIGKPVTSSLGKDGKIHSYGHESEGEKLTRAILWDEDIKRRERVCAMIKWHMGILDVLNHKNYLERILEISREVGSLNLLIALKICDLHGSETKDPCRRDNYNTLKVLTRICNIMCSDGLDRYLPLYNQIPWFTGSTTLDIYVMIGLPGAGKSTHIKEIVDKKNIENYAIVSRDDIRIKLGQCKTGEKYIGTPEEEEAVTEEFNRELIAAVRKVDTIFIDNLNIRRKYRDGYKNLLKGYKVRWIYVYVQAPSLEDNIERREGQVPVSVFKPMTARVEWPSASEYDELQIKITDDYGKV